MSQSPNDWQREDFIALVLHYAANADLNISSEEQGLITKMVGQAHYDKALSYFNDASDYETIQKIVELKGHFFAGDDGKEKLNAILLDLFKSDEDFSSMEQNVMHALDRIL